MSDRLRQAVEECTEAVRLLTVQVQRYAAWTQRQAHAAVVARADATMKTLGPISGARVPAVIADSSSAVSGAAAAAASTAAAVHPQYSNGLPQNNSNVGRFHEMFGTTTGMAWTNEGQLLMACPNHGYVCVFERSAQSGLYERSNSVYGPNFSEPMDPWGIAYHNGSLYVCCHSHNRIYVMEGGRMRTLWQGFVGAKSLSMMKTIAVGTRDGHTYAVVHDSGNRRVFYFVCDNNVPAGFLVLKGRIADDAEVGIAFDNVGRVAVSNSETGEVQIIGLIPEPGSCERPSYSPTVVLGSGIRSSAIAFDHYNNLVVLDCTHRSVTIVNCVTGETLHQVLIVGWTPCCAVTVDSAGNVLVPCREECGAVRRITFQ